MTMVCYLGDAAPGLGSHAMDESWASLMTMSQAVATPPAVCSRFESLALRAGRVSPEAGDLLGVLLAAALPLQSRGCEVLRPLWAEEAMHRADSFVRLVDSRDRRHGSTHEGPGTAQEANGIASDLAVCFRKLTASGEREMRPCASALRDVMTGLGALFGEPDNVSVETKVEDVWLPAYKRRALVLAASELVCNALLHAFRGRRSGLIEVSLTVLGATSACLQVADNGDGFTDASPNLECGVAAGLAGLLEADLAYDRMAGWTIAEIEFPLSGS
jgi:two-component sensor histidine kinase